VKYNWPTKKLGEVCKIYNGGTPDTKKLSYWGSDHFWITPKDMGSLIDMYVEETSRKITDAGLKNSSAKILPPNSIILSSRAPIGYLAINKVPMATNQGCKGLIPNKELGFLFLFYFLFNSTELLNKLGSGTTFKELSGSKLAEIEIPLPSLPEQQRIVKLLDEIFEKITKAKENTEKNLQNTKDLFESYLQSVFANPDYEVKTLGELCKSVEYGSSSKSKTIGEIPVLRMGNIQNSRFDWNNLVYSDDIEENKKYLLKYNDVLFNRTNSPELVGKTAIYKGEMPAIFAGYLIRINRNENLLDADYLNYFLNSDIAKDYGKTVVISSVNQANINGTKLKNYPIPAPSLVDQKTIVAKLDALSEQTKKLETIYKQKLADLEELKKAVLRSAFAGKL